MVERLVKGASAGDNAFFVDRDPDLFAAILRFHDTGECIACELSGATEGRFEVTPNSLLREAQYYNMPSLEQQILNGSSDRPAVKYEYCHRLVSFVASINRYEL